MPMTPHEQYEMYNRMLYDGLHRLEMRVRETACHALDYAGNEDAFRPASGTYMIPWYVPGAFSPSSASSYDTVELLLPRFPDRDANLLIAEASIRRDVAANIQRRQETE